MYNYDSDKFIEDGEEVYGLKDRIEDIAEGIYFSGIKNILFTGIGGTIFELMGIKKIFDRYSSYTTFILDGAELIIENPKFIGKGTLVITGSKSGDTKETVEACRYCRNKGAKVISIVSENKCPLAKNSDYTIVSDIQGMTHLYLKFYILALKLINLNGEYDSYNKFISEIKKLYPSLVEVQEKFESEAVKIADNYANADYQMWVGSGILWGEINLFTMCILEEMQWMRTKAVKSSDFFHGSLELVDKNTPIYLVKGIDEYRKLDDRVEKFLDKIGAKPIKIDLDKYRLGNISPEFSEILSPIVFNALTRGRLAYHFERVTGHSLDTRRYYRKLDY